jgi:hypothetical protein
MNFFWLLASIVLAANLPLKGRGGRGQGVKIAILDSGIGRTV